MPRDLAHLLEQTAQEPQRPFDADQLVRRAHRQSILAKTAAGTALVALVLGGVAVAFQLLEGPQPSVITEPSNQPAPVSILEEPQDSEDLLPPEVLDNVDSIDQDGARTARLARSTATRDYFVVHQPDYGRLGGPGICLIVWNRDAPEPFAGCGSWGSGGDEGILLRLQGPHGTAGIAADGVETVNSDTVHNNVFISDSEPFCEQLLALDQASPPEPEGNRAEEFTELLDASEPSIADAVETVRDYHRDIYSEGDPTTDTFNNMPSEVQESIRQIDAYATEHCENYHPEFN